MKFRFVVVCRVTQKEISRHTTEFYAIRAARALNKTASWGRYGVNEYEEIEIPVCDEHYEYLRDLRANV